MPASEARVDPCPDCGGRGWVVVADGGAGTARACACREQDAIPRLLTAAGIPARYQNCKISTFQTSGGAPRERAQLMNARAAAERYVEEFVQEDGGFRQSGLLFVGPPGTGKTHLAVGVLRALIERYRVRGLFVEFTSLIHQIQSTFDPNSPESKRQILDPLTNAELLVLDELGAQQPTPWVRDILYLIINTRYTRRLPTLFTTNYRSRPAGRRGAEGGRQARPRRSTAAATPEPVRSFDEAVLLSSRLPAMLVSRLYEMAQPMVLDAVEDFRREHAVHGAHRDEALRRRLPAPRLDEPVGELGAGAPPVAAGFRADRADGFRRFPRAADPGRQPDAYELEGDGAVAARPGGALSGAPAGARRPAGGLAGIAPPLLLLPGGDLRRARRGGPPGSPRRRAGSATSSAPSPCATSAAGGGATSGATSAGSSSSRFSSSSSAAWPCSGWGWRRSGGGRVGESRRGRHRPRRRAAAGLPGPDRRPRLPSRARPTWRARARACGPPGAAVSACSAAAWAR